MNNSKSKFKYFKKEQFDDKAECSVSKVEFTFILLK
jgi:hypothetical protein